LWTSSDLHFFFLACLPEPDRRPCPGLELNPTLVFLRWTPIRCWLLIDKPARAWLLSVCFQKEAKPANSSPPPQLGNHQPFSGCFVFSLALGPQETSSNILFPSLSATPIPGIICNPNRQQKHAHHGHKFGSHRRVAKRNFGSSASPQRHVLLFLAKRIPTPRLHPCPISTPASFGFLQRSSLRPNSVNDHTGSILTSALCSRERPQGGGQEAQLFPLPAQHRQHRFPAPQDPAFCCSRLQELHPP
jgi:hypothetical protein